MDFEKPKFHMSKLITTSRDLSDQFTLSLMFAVSLASVGFQTTQDRLICIPAVDCSDLARNDSVVRKWSEANDILDICSRSSSSVVLTTMPDQRQYDYVDNECYKKMHWFPAYYSFIFLYLAMAFVAISYFWVTDPKTASTLAHCEHLLSEIIKGDILISTGEEKELKRQKKELLKRLEVFEECYSHEITKSSYHSVTRQYRRRGKMGLCNSVFHAIFCIVCYYLSTGWTPCDLEGHIVFSTEHKRFQCTRSNESFFHGTYFFFVFLLFCHGLDSLRSVLWSHTGLRRKPEYMINFESGKVVQYKGDAAFVLHLIDESKGKLLFTVMEKLLEDEPGQLQEELGERSPFLEPLQP